jgi:hypothetical protein
VLLLELPSIYYTGKIIMYFLLVILRVPIKWPMDTLVEDLLTYQHVRDYHTHRPLSHSSLFVPMHL